MKKGILCMLLLYFSLCLLSGCGSSSDDDTTAVKTSRVTSKTLGAIKAEETNIISLFGGDLEIDTNYRVAISEDKNTEITSYFVFNNDKVNAIADEKDGRSGDDYYNALKNAWDEAQRIKAEQSEKFSLFGKKDNEEEAETTTEVFTFDTDAYITPYHEDVMLYVYSGIDRATPASELKDYEIRASIRNYVTNTLGANVELRNVLYDTYPVPQVDENSLFPYLNNPTLNGDYYVMSFTANAGNEFTTTYGTIHYAKQYYGIYFMEKNVWNGSFRRWYGIVFTNDSVGDVLDQNFYESIFEQLRNVFGITQYYTDILDTTVWNYDVEKDFRNGKSYEQLLTTFHDTMNFYTLTENKKTEIVTETTEETESNTDPESTETENN